MLNKNPLLLVFAWLVVMACWIPSSWAQRNISDEQLQLLRELSPEQQEQLLRTLGISRSEIAESEALEFPEIVEQPDAAGVGQFDPDDEDEETRIEPGSTVIVRLELPAMEADDRQKSLEIAELMLRNPRLGDVRGAATYVLDKNGVIEFEGVASVLVRGLTGEQAARRIEAEPALSIFEAEVLLLPIEPSGVDALEVFGAYLFEGAPVTFAPATDVPVPAGYMLGPGDHLRLQLFGTKNLDVELVINRDGVVNLPEIGPVVVAGLTLDDARTIVQAQIQEQMIGVSAYVTMGELRSIRVFVLGDVNRPGSFTVSGLSTITNALFVSGGISPVGSMRDIQLKRKGEVVGRIDLYDLLLRGDTRADLRLQPNDVIFVPPRGATVAIDGEVQRPAIYELRNEQTVSQVVELAGGLTAAAYPETVRLERVDPDAGREIRTLDVTTQVGGSYSIKGGDAVYVDPVLDIISSGVTLKGHVYRSGNYEWTPGMTLTDLVPSPTLVRPGSDTNYLLVVRESEPGGQISVVSGDLAAALQNPGGAEDIRLEERDVVHVFALDAGRAHVLDPLMERLRLQAVFGDPVQEVTIGGTVRAPGVYPLEDEMRVSDLIRAGANLDDAAYGLSAEITRYTVQGGAKRDIDLIEVDLESALAGDEGADLLLQPFDYLSIKEIAQWRRQGVVTIEGEVRFPGQFPIEAGETLRSVIYRAGGLTTFAFPAGSIFLREDLKEREREQIGRLINRLEADLAALALQGTRAVAGGGGQVDQALVVGQSLLGELRGAEPIGRMVIDLDRLISGGTNYDVVLRDGDRLIIPEKIQEVTVIGEVQLTTSHLFNPQLRRDDYIDLSGGLTANADRRRIYVVRANGAVVTQGDRSAWYRRRGVAMQTGDTIVVPLDVDRVPKLALWQSVTTILYNLAISAAAVGSL